MNSSRSSSIFDKSTFVNRSDLDDSNIAEKSNQNLNKSALFVAKLLDHIDVIDLEKIESNNINAKLFSTRGHNNLVLEDGVKLESEKLILTDQLLRSI